MPHTYPASSYDDDFCLKPSLILWIAAVFLSRALLLPVAMGFAHFAGVNDDVQSLLRDIWSLEYVAPSAVALPVLYSLIRRAPTAPASVRWIWSRGRMFLALSASIDLLVSIGLEIRQDSSGDSPHLSLGLGAIDLYFLLYILATRRVRDTFASFPAPLHAKEK